jgi:hypothetical protein
MADSPHVVPHGKDTPALSHGGSLPSTWRAATGVAAQAYATNTPAAVLEYYQHVFARADHHGHVVRETLPELGLLLGVACLDISDIKSCLGSIGVSGVILDDPRLFSAARTILSRVGAVAFSFPEWRFLSQPLSNKGDGHVQTLLECAGMRRLVRDSDLRGETTPEDPPSLSTPHDFGRGFEYTDGAYRFELRRAYVLLSPRDGSSATTLLVRNSSPYFGRNRLQHAAYVSVRALDDHELRGLSRADIEDGSWFVPLEELLTNQTTDRQLLTSCLARMESLSKAFLGWNVTLGGRFFSLDAPTMGQQLVPEELRGAMCALLRSMLQGQTAPSAALVLLPKEGPTFPALAALPVTHELVESLSVHGEALESEEYERFCHIARTAECRCALLSSPRGDWPG